MEKMNIEPIVMNNKYSKIFIHPIIGNFNEATGRGWFAVSLKDYENQPLETKVFNEEWDIVDATYPGEKYYYTWIKVTYFGNKVPVKVTYSNGTHKWKAMNDLLTDIKDKTFDDSHSFRITEMRIRPYRYTDDYGHNRIAGQLQFVGVESDETYYPRFISDQLPDEIDKIDIPEEEVVIADWPDKKVQNEDVRHHIHSMIRDEIIWNEDYEANPEVKKEFSRVCKDILKTYVGGEDNG